MFEKEYMKKAEKLNISPNFIKKALNHKSKNTLKLVRLSKNPWEFQINIEGELYNNQESKPSDFTYLMGLEFGVFNRYQALEISEEIKKKVVLARPNREKTLEVLNNNANAMANYLCTQYELDKTYIFDTMSQMFDVHKKNPNFASDIAIDIGKMLTAYYMCFQGKSIQSSSQAVQSFFEEGQAITYFNLHNKIDQKQKK